MNTKMRYGLFGPILALLLFSATAWAQEEVNIDDEVLLDAEADIELANDFSVDDLEILDDTLIDSDVDLDTAVEEIDLGGSGAADIGQALETNLEEVEIDLDIDRRVRLRFQELVLHWQQYLDYPPQL